MTRSWPTLLCLLVVPHASGADFDPPPPQEESCVQAIATLELLQAHLERYPAMRHTDAFKLLQQSLVGSEHAIEDTMAVHNWMSREWSTMGHGPEEPLVDTLGADGRYARVHLRALAIHGGNPARLVSAFIRTGHSYRGDTISLGCSARAFEGAAKRGDFPWPADSIAAFRRAWAARGYPAVSHSPEFRTAYKPAYRVVALPLVGEVVSTGK